MLRKVAAYVEKWQMIEKEDKIIVGVSGGADSICLLFVLSELQKTYGFELVAVHINHGLRGAAAKEDELYVKRICEAKKIPYVVYSENVELLAKKRKQSIEEAGRDIRRQMFVKTAEEYGGTKIALAHHKNDNAETLIMNLARGTGLQGLCGISPVNGTFIRPLLCVSRQEIEKYLHENHISYCIDETNASDDYTRNRVRNHVIPYLEEHVNSQTVEHIDETMESLREIRQFLKMETEKYASDCVKQTEEGYLLLGEALESVPQAIRTLLIKQVLAEVAGKARDLESAHISSVLELLKKQVSRKVDLPYGMIAKRVYDGVEIARNKEEAQAPFSMQLPEPQENLEKVTLWNGYRISYRIYKKEDWEKHATEKSNTKAFDYDIISGVLCVRTRNAGDYITLTSDGGTQKLKSYFVNQKIEQSLREQIPLIAEGSHILWIVGYRINPAYRVSRNTKRVLEIRIEGD